MNRYEVDLEGTRAVASVFAPPGGARETHVMVEAAPEQSFEAALVALTRAYHAALAAAGSSPRTCVFRRLFGSDLANQAARLRDHDALGAAGEHAVAVSLIEQPPLPDRKLALWAYHVDDASHESDLRGDTLALARPGRIHLWSAGLVSDSQEGAGAQTEEIFAAYERRLAEAGATLARHVVRTWLFVRDVDRDYGDLVRVRRELFAARGLTASTHYIASTGIEGRTHSARHLVAMDAWAVAGLDEAQIRFLSAPTHLGPTSAYGVTFERGTSVSYGDRRHVILSGTASIDPCGEVVSEGAIDGQVARTASNIFALLADAKAGLGDLSALVVYLRDPADFTATARAVASHFPGVPHLLVRAPVCRPQWLVEIEALAIVADGDSRWPRF